MLGWAIQMKKENGMVDADVYVPGQMLDKTVAPAGTSAGTGVWERDGVLRAAAAGRLEVEGGRAQIRKMGGPSGASRLPNVGSIVVGRVSRINMRQATVNILLVEGEVVRDEFQGMIRTQDVRSFDKDKVRILTSFHPGDIVRARVIALGDQSSYILSTASDELGVILGYTQTGVKMHPISWNTMRSLTGELEERKCARP